MLLIRDAQVVRDALEQSRTALGDVAAALADADIDRAAAQLAQADAALAQARSRSGGPLWSIASVIPVAGDSIDVVRSVVAVGSAAVDIAAVAVHNGGDLLANGLDIRMQDGQIDLSIFDDATAILDAMPVERLRGAHDTLVAIEPRWAPDEVIEGRLDALAMTEEVLTLVDRAQSVLAVMPSFLGADEPRRYFLGVQTPAEARGTGGLIGFWAVLQVDNGHISMGQSSTYDPFDEIVEEDEAAVEVEGEGESSVTSQPVSGDIRSLVGDPDDRVSVTPEFEARYGHVNASGMWANVNVHPDLPTTAQVMIDLFEHRTSEQVDGVILIDPVAMQFLLEATQHPIDVPDEFDHPDLPRRIEPTEFAQFVVYDIYEIYGVASTEQRKMLFRVLGDRVMEALLGGEWNGIDIVQAIVDATRQRHLQVFSVNPVEQRQFVAMDVAGSLEPRPSADFLAMTVNNAVGGKQDAYVELAFDVQIDLGQPYELEGQWWAHREMTVDVQLENRLPSAGRDLYVIGNCTIDDGGSCFAGPPGWNRSWVTAWTRSSDLVAVAAGGVPASVGTFQHLGYVDVLVETPPLARRWWTITASGVTPLQRAPDGSVDYRLYWPPQPRMLAPQSEVTITARSAGELLECDVEVSSSVVIATCANRQIDHD